LVDLQSISYRAFLALETPEMVILSVLSDFEEKEAAWIVRQIFKRLKQLDEYPKDLQKHSHQFDMLSVLRNLQQEVIKQEKAMGLTLKIENDLQYHQEHVGGVEQTAINMLKEKTPLDFISKVTGLSLTQIKVLLRELKPKSIAASSKN
jgi:hypothetical protein